MRFLYPGLSLWGRDGSESLQVEKHVPFYFFPYNSGTFPIKGCFFDVVASTFNWDVTLWIYMFWSLIFWSSRDPHSGWFRNWSGCFFTLWHVKKSMVIRIMAYLVSRSFQNPVLITLRCKVVSFCCDDEGCLFDVVIIQTEITKIITVFSIQMTFKEDDVTIT